MRIEKIDNSTIKCYLTEEELHEYDIEYDDFVSRTDKAKEVVKSIMMRAEEEVGYQPPRFAFDLQIMVVPGDGLVLTFSEKHGSSEPLGRDLKEALKELKRLIGEPDEDTEDEDPAPSRHREKAGDSRSQDGRRSEDVPSLAKQQDLKQERKEPSTFGVFEFASMREIMEYVSILPGTLRVDSSLYKLDGAFFIIIRKGTASYERFSHACVQAMEFSSLYSASEDKVKYIEEHGECLVAEKVLKKLAMK